MKTKIKLRITTLVMSMLASYLSISQEVERKKMNFDGESVKVISIYHEVPIEADADKIWYAISDEYTKIGDFHSGIASSYQISGTPATGIGAKRHCQIDEKISVKEEIKVFNQGKKQLSYDVYEFTKFPGKVFRYHMGINEKEGKTYLYGRLSYKLKPGIMTGFAKGRMKKINIENLLIYKNYIENNDSSKPNAKELRKAYESSLISSK